MADTHTTVNLGENSPQYVAYRLTWEVLKREKPSDGEYTRAQILNTYAECLHAANGYRNWEKPTQR